MRWYNVELKAEDADKLSVYLKANNFYYEKSDCGFGYRHMEIKCNAKEALIINYWIRENI